MSCIHPHKQGKDDLKLKHNAGLTI